MTGAGNVDTARRGARRSRWRPDGMVLLIAGIFAAMLAANGVMLTLALQAQPELVARDYYRRGQDYDRVIAARQASRDTGWRVAVQRAGTQGVRLHVTDDAGRPVSGLRGKLHLYRPDDAALDRTVPLRPGAHAAGVYRSDVPLRPGPWELTVDLRNGSGRLYETLRRHVRPAPAFGGTAAPPVAPDPAPAVP